MSTPIKISTLNVKKLSINKKNDIVKGLEDFESGASKRFGTEGEIKYNGKSFLTQFNVLVSKEIVAKDWAMNGKEGKYYTLAVCLEDEADVQAFADISDLITADVNDGEWLTVNPLNMDNLNLKMKFGGELFNCRFNGKKISVNADTGITVGAELTVIGVLSVDYVYSLEKPKAKLMFTATKVNF